MKNLERLALVGALAAAVFVEGSLNARVKDLAQQRDIYQSRSANWERDALNWQTEAKEAEAQVADLKAALEAAQAGPPGLKQHTSGSLTAPPTARSSTSISAAPGTASPPAAHLCRQA